MSKQNQTKIDRLETRLAELERQLREREAQVNGLQRTLKEADLILAVGQNLLTAKNLNEVYAALAAGIVQAGADTCLIQACDDLDANDVPRYSEIVFAGNDTDGSSLVGHRFPLTHYPALRQIIQTQTHWVIADINTDERLSVPDRTLLSKLGGQSVAVYPLVARTRVIGLVLAQYQNPHAFEEQEVALCRTLCDQAIAAIENAMQMQRTEVALTETQTLYRAGRVLAGTTSLEEILQESLFEFLYSLGLDQGGIILISPDHQEGELVAYVQDGQVQSIGALKFPINDSAVYQEVLISGQPFTSTDVQNDPRLAGFRHFNEAAQVKSLLQAPIIIRGETIGWIGADAIKRPREFSQREIDLARAMADQIAITIQNRRLLEKSERQAEQLKAVAQVGRSVSQLIDLDEILSSTVDLIRDQFGFYHVSIFLLDETRQWAVVRASTGEVGKIMVERPHRLEVGGRSIVGYVTGRKEPRVALDVGEDRIHFNNPLLPNTRSEMALPLIARGVVIGALDVQSVQPNAFGQDDVDTLQIMADQLTAAIENARLFEQTERRLAEQEILYQLGLEVSGTLNLQDATDILVTRTAAALGVAECVLNLLEDDEVYVISDYIRPDSAFQSHQGQRLKADEFVTIKKILATKKELIGYSDNPQGKDWEFDYLAQHNGSAFIIIPLLFRNQVIGSLEIYDDTAGRRFEQTDINLLSSIALQAAGAIENARLYEAARESQAFMKSIIDQIPDPIFIKNREHAWVVVNKAFCEGMLGLPEEQVLGRTDYDYLPREEADWFWTQDSKMFETGQVQETEETISDPTDRQRILYTRKIPLFLNNEVGQPDYLLGIMNDITERKQRELERERLMAETQKNLERTQSLYRISEALSAATELKATFEVVLGEYLGLLNLAQGSLMLLNPKTSRIEAQARFLEGRPATPNYSLPVEQDLVFQHLARHLTPLIIEDVHNHPLLKDSRRTRGQGQTKSMLFIPIIIRDAVIGSMVVDSTEAKRSFSPSDIDLGEAIADQLAIWLESRRLLEEAQHRSNLLKTAAEVSGAASSILDVNVLINTSVNLIRDKFDFYYVGLFLLDETRRWAVLQAGTGEAGRAQLENKHKLRIGNDSMIGWSMAHRQARIASDVGKEEVFFRNPFLPDTHSEMALPLISRDEVIGALTVQSVEPGAFTDEDITLLQTMADQLANVIANARLYENVAKAQKEAEARLQETVALQELSQALSSTLQINDILDILFQACTKVIGFDYVMFSLVDKNRDLVKAVAGIGVSDNNIDQAVKSLTSHDIMADVIRTGKTEIITGWDERFDKQLYDTEGHHNWVRLFTPLTLRQENIGLIEAGFKNVKPHTRVEDSQVRLLRAFLDQTALALDNAQRYEVSRRAAQREEIIREITGKIRGSVSIDDILKTTITELGKALGASHGGVMLDVSSPISETDLTYNEEPNHHL